MQLNIGPMGASAVFHQRLTNIVSSHACMLPEYSIHRKANTFFMDINSSITFQEKFYFKSINHFEFLMLRSSKEDQI